MMQAATPTQHDAQRQALRRVYQAILSWPKPSADSVNPATERTEPALSEAHSSERVSMEILLEKN